MEIQASIFDDSPRYKIKKRVRLIELFAGIGAQSKALERLGVDFERYRVCEFDRFAIRSYNAIHGANFMPTDIRQWHGKDLGIIDTDKYEYILTYSFPCTDLSVAGQMKGMSRGGGTRSGLLWEVERLLKETEHLPQILLMENVPQVCADKNADDWAEWLAFLESKGYENFYKVLNAKDYGVPQNRERCFMISILNGRGYEYDFPRKVKLTKCLKDLLEKNVDEKYYLSLSTIEMFVKHAAKKQAQGCGLKFEPTKGNGVAKCILTRAGSRTEDNFILECSQVGELKGGKWDKVFKSARRVYGVVGLSPTMCTRSGGNTEIKVLIEETGDRVRKLTPLECFRLMDFDDDDYEKVKAIGMSDSQMYKQAGNSIVVACLEEIFRNLF